MKQFPFIAITWSIFVINKSVSLLNLPANISAFSRKSNCSAPGRGGGGGEDYEYIFFKKKLFVVFVVGIPRSIPKA